MVDLTTPISALLLPLGLDLYDLEFTKGSLNVTVNKDGGVDVDSLAKANRTISEWLDENDPFPGRYTLDVSSPGLERRLRTSTHFTTAIGTLVTLREMRKGEATRRLEGELVSVTNNTIVLRDNSLGEISIEIDNVERARTVFVWGATAKPTPSKGRPQTSSKGRK